MALKQHEDFLPVSGNSQRRDKRHQTRHVFKIHKLNGGSNGTNKEKSIMQWEKIGKKPTKRFINHGFSSPSCSIIRG